MKFSAIARSSCFVLVLAGCGGTTSNTANTAEGAWSGTTTNNGNAATLVVLEDGQTFGLASTNAGIAEGFYGSIVGNGGSLKGGSGKDVNFGAHTVTGITWSGSLSAKSSISATTSTGVTIAGSFNANYDQLANIATLATSYNGFGAAAAAGASEAMPVTITSAGVVTITGSTCVGTGTVLARGNGKNVFNIRIGFVGVSCPLGNNATTIGVVFLDQTVSPARLSIMTMTNDAGDGFFWTSV
jgi:hypothetical protein